MYIKHYTGLTRQQRGHGSRKSTGRRRERRRKKTGGSQRQPEVKTVVVMTMRRRAVSLISAGFRILICCTGKRMGRRGRM